MSRAEGQDKQTAWWELSCTGRGNLCTLSDPGFSICPRPRGNIPSLWGFVGRGRKADVIRFQMAASRKEKNRKQAPGFGHNSHFLQVSHRFFLQRLTNTPAARYVSATFWETASQIYGVTDCVSMSGGTDLNEEKTGADGRRLSSTVSRQLVTHV